ncbi:WXG100 family type VII secretion target [Nocardia sp. NPDC058497]|uniref:WXG100 family type VII secretion target n=1 Tax=Nocardia sp. NPDC058497 TaxID=3346529 RepID=UPI00365A9B26
MAANEGFDVDLDHLDEVTIRIRGYKEFVAQNIEALEQRAAQLASDWSGATASAYAIAHRTCLAGVAEVREQLADVEANARAAHFNYTEAAATNSKMLGS